MMKKFSALLLSLALCLGLIGTAFAVDANVSVKAGTNGVTLTGTLQNGTYLLCSIAKDGKPVAAFNITPDDFTEGTNTLSKKIDVALDPALRELLVKILAPGETEELRALLGRLDRRGK